MILSDRKRKILKAVVDDYIETAEPVSSKDICDKYLSDCSPATVRNELSALESMGYLVQPHVSAGRVPSQKAFRLYVDELMTSKPLTEDEIMFIDSYFDRRADNIEELVTDVAKVISEITHLTSVVVKSEEEFDETIRKVTVVELTGNNALIIVVTDNRVLRDNIVTLPDNIDADAIVTANNWLNKVFVGKKISEIGDFESIKTDISADFALYRELYKQIVELLRKTVDNKAEVHTSGSSRIFEYPEYNDVSKARNFLTKLETKDELRDIFDTSGENIETVVKIGEEAGNLPEDCSVISTKINIKDKTIGTAGVIGPVRMNYTKVISVLEHIGKLIDKMLTE